MNERIFTCVIREAAGRVPAGQCGHSAASDEGEADLRIEEQRRRKNRTAREMIAEEGRGCGHVQRRLRRHAAHAVPADDVRCGNAVKPAGRRAVAPDEREPRRHGVGSIELLDRQHGTEAIDELDDRRLADPCLSGVGDRVLVAAFDVDGEVERAAGRDVGMEPRFVGERRHRPPAKSDVRHRDPGGELADRLGDEAGRKRGDVRRHGVAAARAPSGLVLGDAVDEREGGKVISHAAMRAPRPHPAAFLLALRGDDELAEGLRA